MKNLDKPDSWGRLPAPTLDADTAERLAVAMPGTASFLERHEWIKHGTCFFGGDDGQTYFTQALRAIDAVNASGVSQLFATHVGADLRASDIRAAFDAAFGAGTGERVQVQCAGDQGRVLIQEISISLRGKMTDGADLGELIRAASPQSVGCDHGIVDPAGLQ